MSTKRCFSRVMSVFRERILRAHLCKARRVFEGHKVAKSLLNLHYLGLIAMIKFMYSEKVIRFCKTSTLLLSYVVPVKSEVEISQTFVAFSGYMIFT